MALIGRQATGRGTKVETSLFASGIWCNSEAVVSTQFQRKHLNPDPSRPSNPFDNFYLCGDGRWLGMYTNEYCRDRDKFARVLGMTPMRSESGSVPIMRSLPTFFARSTAR